MNPWAMVLTSIPPLQVLNSTSSPHGASQDIVIRHFCKCFTALLLPSSRHHEPPKSQITVYAAGTVTPAAPASCLQYIPDDLSHTLLGFVARQRLRLANETSTADIEYAVET